MRLQFITLVSLSLSIFLTFGCDDSGPTSPDGGSDADMDDADIDDEMDGDTPSDADNEVDADVERDCSPLEVARPEVFDDVLRHLLDAESVSEGDWDGDFGDATCYAPPVLLAHGRATCSEREVSLAWETVEREYFVIQHFMEHSSEALIGGLGLTEVYALEPDSEVAENGRLLIDYLWDAISLLGEEGMLPAAMSEPYGQTATTGIVAALMLRYVIQVDPDDTVVRDRALELTETIDGAVYDSSEGYYWRGIEDSDLYLYPNVAMSLVHSLAHHITGDEAHLERARRLLPAIEELYVPDVGAYHSPYQGTEPDYASLSSHNYLVLALIYLFDETGEEIYLETANGALDFIQERLLVEGIAYHHWEADERADWYCTGCNLQLLYVLWQMGMRTSTR